MSETVARTQLRLHKGDCSDERSIRLLLFTLVNNDVAWTDVHATKHLQRESILGGAIHTSFYTGHCSSVRMVVTYFITFTLRSHFILSGFVLSARDYHTCKACLVHFTWLAVHLRWALCDNPQIMQTIRSHRDN